MLCAKVLMLYIMRREEEWPTEKNKPDDILKILEAV
jgi:hypothetical protein